MEHRGTEGSRSHHRHLPSCACCSWRRPNLRSCAMVKCMMSSLFLPEPKATFHVLYTANKWDHVWQFARPVPSEASPAVVAAETEELLSQLQHRRFTQDVPRSNCFLTLRKSPPADPPTWSWQGGPGGPPDSPSPASRQTSTPRTPFSGRHPQQRHPAAHPAHPSIREEPPRLQTQKLVAELYQSKEA